ncbi:class F sortase [Pseudokineococcus sp. 1T1Z-3]|uniref:class F sortase n=1 Tax=Pseudokineococcus sp. 1T1Z-3 TaxID=3132745 RepID=UPI0030AFE422
MTTGPETPSAAGADVSPRGRRRPPRRVWALALVLALAVPGAALVVTGLVGDEPEVVTASPAPEPAPEPTPSTWDNEPRGLPAPVQHEPQPTAVAALDAPADVRLRIPAVDLDLPVHALEPEQGAINPPTMTDAYWISPYGEPGAGASAPDNTVYIAAHSWSRGDAAFDPLLDDDFEGSTLEEGDVVAVESPSGTVEYAVTGVARYGKDALPAADAVWQVSPGRLVLITCFQREDGARSTENLVVTAERLGATSG